MKKIIILLSIIVLSSCSNKLSNSKAENLISEHLELPKKETWKIEYNLSWVGWKRYYEIYKPLVKKGLLYSNYRGRGLNGYLHTEPTKKAKKYIVKNNKKEFEVELCTQKFGKIISIHEIPQMNAAEVKYTIIRTNFTPFGKLYRTYWNNKPLEKSITKSIMFKKLNDGWAIDN